jgi:hypothetical protein
LLFQKRNHLESSTKKKKTCLDALVRLFTLSQNGYGVHKSVPFPDYFYGVLKKDLLRRISQAIYLEPKWLRCP